MDGRKWNWSLPLQTYDENSGINRQRLVCLISLEPRRSIHPGSVDLLFCGLSGSVVIGPETKARKIVACLYSVVSRPSE